ncbi:hypothetical protein [Streptomyces sp. NPDC001380]|uniref:hypothetical protein n=1 Tax=Streptomyces sp. NPDC001380 TaxID=3364566 RepID=UPI0036C84CC6
MGSSTGVRTVAAAAAVLLLAAGCESGGSRAPEGSSAPAAAASAPAASAPDPAPSPEPVPYGRTLAGLVDPVGRALERAAAARSTGALDGRLDDARRAASDAARGLDAAVPPADAAQPHRDLAAALDRLAGDIDAVRSGMGAGRYCTASAALAGLGASAGLRALPGPLRRLADAGYRTSYRPPRTGPVRDRRRATGSYVRSGSRTGRGSLTIENGGGRDAVVSLARGGRTVHSVYVRRGSTFKVRGVRDGTYAVYFTSGRDWDGSARRFTRDCGFSRFDDTMRFATVTTATQIRWTTWRLTLQPVAGGNARTTGLDARSFPTP